MPQGNMETMTMAIIMSPEAQKPKHAILMLNPLLRKHTATPPLSDRHERTSFASFKEERSAIAQSFIDSKTSSYARAAEEAIDDAASEDSTPVEQGHHLPAWAYDCPQAMTNPSSTLHPFVCPCEGFRGWKQISVGGRAASRSSGDLRALSKGFSWESPSESRSKAEKPRADAGQSFLERLPTELLGNIIDRLVTDIPPNGCQPRNIDLMSLLLTSRAMHSATLATLYNHVTIPHSKVFRKFLTHISAHPALGTIVRRLDFSHFNPTGAGMTARERAQIQNLTPRTLLESLQLLPNLREFLAQEHIDEELSADVLRKLFEMPRIQGLDFCACSSTPFRDAMMSVFRSPRAMDLPRNLPITRLSFHGCTILPSGIFESILPRLPRLTHLDLTHTRVTDDALASIPRSTRLTHLSLSKCSSLSGERVVEFVRTHPAVKDSLVYLNLLMDAKSHEMLDEHDVTALLPILPDTLRSLNLKGSKMSRQHAPLLLPLTKHLEELGVGRNLFYEDVIPFLRRPAEEEGAETKSQPHHTLHYMDLSDLEVNQLDFGLLFGSKTSILKAETMPLEVIEVGPKIFEKLKEKEHIFRTNGWVVKEAGRRGWLVRDVAKLKTGEREGYMDDGRRDWKMGATYWGMRKVPIAQAEVGGMYGLYMFKR